MTDRQCRWCGKELTRRQKKYCSLSCSKCGQNRRRAYENRINQTR